MPQTERKRRSHISCPVTQFLGAEPAPCISYPLPSLPRTTPYSTRTTSFSREPPLSPSPHSFPRDSHAGRNARHSSNGRASFRNSEIRQDDLSASNGRVRMTGVRGRLKVKKEKTGFKMAFEALPSVVPGDPEPFGIVDVGFSGGVVWCGAWCVWRLSARYAVIRVPSTRR